jgi:two-component system cell cycle response regulator
VVEDNETSLELIVYLLQAFGHTLLTARDGLEGLEIAHHQRPDLILIDIHMPRMDGYELARQLRNDPALDSTSLVAITALAMVGDRDKALAAGFDGYIAKPIDPEMLESQVKAFL